MIWQTWHDFLAMGGYAPYVWGSVGATAAGVLIEVLALRARRRAALSKGRP
ncbi:heme exporter protein CcmD [Massilia phosphatilytica]|jgi:heme exporter protein D|uniref:Heme exporter protein D n=1 Tax=Telluria mixta TaxID=34071 RepID=A0ABT2BXP0_9BURK|nr:MULTISPECIES: heme exporter protein CcmD [Telluria group]MCS0613933.1 heme exporter protein CcmD [Massilia kyonggiensis]MCS0629902.1 heme exporter protein CcmD [Telluria mixta]PQO89857.1 heme exporter protein CcmD [Massilia phosphatilytica]WEM96545.1 heme exporter protein CcmD [Telluria mixta]